MSLIVPPWAFTQSVSNIDANKPPTGGGVGDSFATGISNADGTAVTMLPALAFDVHYLIIGINGISLSTVAFYALADILVDPAGGTSWTSLIDDLVCGFTPINSISQQMTLWYHFPIFIKAGSSVGIRARSSHTVASTAETKCVMWAYGNPTRPDMWWCGSKVESLGPVPATSRGTPFTPGNTGTFGTWTTMGTTTSRYGAVQYGINGSDSAMLAVGYYFQIGYSSLILPGSPTMHVAGDTTEIYLPSGNWGPIWCDIPSGTVMQMRGTCSGTAEAYDGAIYGVY